jgi:hypothetical protein
MIVEPLTMKHYDDFAIQDAQSHFKAFLGNRKYRDAMILSGPAYAGLCDGRVMAIAGISEQWEGRGIAWSLLSPNIGHHFIEIHRAVVRALAQTHMRRIEAHVDPTFNSAVRWIQMLGFTYEGTMKRFDPDGRDMDLYARII